ncbi:MAG: uracil-DNA glycosylase [Clostridia bacterium]|nr:uracil-DNA glycosylase [Clostridia bacterium]
MQTIRRECLSCQKCPLHKTRTNVVFGRGNEKASLLFVGEAPGANEDATGEPFVGAAGKLLDQYLEAVGLSRGEYYIANILKCRPPQNRDPNPEEIALCTPFLDRQIEAISPKLIVCLGRIAAMRLIREDFRITREHGQVFEKDGRRLLAVYHPAALLRDPRKKEEMFLDFLKIKKLLEE